MVGLAALAWVIASAWDPVGHQHLSDIPVYHDAAAQMADGQIPYRDFDFEYPPLATLLIGLVYLIPSGYASAFSLVMFGALVATVLGALQIAAELRMSRGRQLATGAIVAVVPLLLGDLVSTRFDLAVAALLTWTLWAAITERFRVMWLLLAAAIALKLIPVVLIPVLVIWQCHRTGRWPGHDLLPGLAATVIVWAPCLIVGASGVWYLASYHMDRPLQVESLGGSYLLGLHALADIPLSIVTSYGSQNISAPGVGVITAMTTGLQVAAVAVVAVVFRLGLRRATPPVALHGFVAAVATTLALLVITGKVLSPQFVLWLIPACLLVVGPYGLLAAAATVATLITTQVAFPYHYWDLIDLQPAPIALLVIRNAILIIVAAAVFPRMGAVGALRRGRDADATDGAGHPVRSGGDEDPLDQDLVGGGLEASR